MIEMNDRTFVYVDKNRLVPWLEEQVKEWERIWKTSDDDIAAAVAAGKVGCLRDIIRWVEYGRFDWQPAE